MARVRRRMIDPNIWESEDFAALSTFAKLLFIGMFSTADDEGRGRAKPVYLRSLLFPYDESIRVADIEKALSEIGSKISVTFYTNNGNKYYQLDHWKKWQKVEKPSDSILPDPENQDSISVLSFSTTNRRLIGDESATNRGTVPPKRKEKNIKEDNIKEKEVLLSGAEDNFAPDQQPVISLVLNDKSEFDVFQNQIAEWEELYPAVDVLQELRKMKGWLDANPSKRKTKNGIMRFINNWLSKEQDKGGKTIDRQQTKTNPQLVKSKPYVDLNPDNDDDFLSKLEEALVDPWEAFQ